ncbi:SCP domain-containing protein [Mycena chlorophos]|uniref:SCP domain-containing protein n=1 Tax=Mycena chlorophos TaxID=658473 RepID=A0A8H6S5T3_MYCCL|nr:SCP domain-containing protein [Mycena chlorophos]
MRAYCLFALIAIAGTLARPLVERDGNGSDASDQDVQSYLNGHNSVRAAHGANPLQWNNTLASKAQTWANKCTNHHSGGTLGPFGENLAAQTGGNFTIPAAMDSWVTGPTEEPAYNANAPVASHFTQIVWKASTQLGCAVQICSDIFPGYGSAQYYVCEFFPPGNVEGEFG